MDAIDAEAAAAELARREEGPLPAAANGPFAEIPATPASARRRKPLHRRRSSTMIFGCRSRPPTRFWACATMSIPRCCPSFSTRRPSCFRRRARVTRMAPQLARRGRGCRPAPNAAHVQGKRPDGGCDAPGRADASDGIAAARRRCPRAGVATALRGAGGRSRPRRLRARWAASRRIQRAAAGGCRRATTRVR